MTAINGEWEETGIMLVNGPRRLKRRDCASIQPAAAGILLERILRRDVTGWAEYPVESAAILESAHAAPDAHSEEHRAGDRHFEEKKHALSASGHALYRGLRDDAIAGSWKWIGGAGTGGTLARLVGWIPSWPWTAEPGFELGCTCRSPSIRCIGDRCQPDHETSVEALKATSRD